MIPNLSATGNYTASYLFMYGGPSLIIGPATATSVQVSVTTFGPINGFIAGTMSGNVLDSVTNNIYPMTGSFNVIRTN